MIRKLVLVFVVMSFLIASAVLAGEGVEPRTTQALIAYTSTGSSFIWVSATEFSDGTAYYTFVGDSFYCETPWGSNSLGLVKVTGSANLGAFEVDTRDLQDLDCWDSTPPAMISVECRANGQLSYHDTGTSTVRFGDGSTTKSAYNYKSQEAECTITADGTVYDQDEFQPSMINYGHGIYRERPLNGLF